MEDKVAVSVIMPAYNAARFIATTLDSVLAQSMRDWELWVIDDCSSDGTVGIVEQYATRDARVRLIRLPKNRGAPAGPRNEGLRAARGRWIAFLDADDIWHPRKLEIQLRAVAATGALFCSTQMQDFVDERDLKFVDPGDPPLENVTFFKQLVKFRTPTSSVVVDRELILRHPFNEDPRFKAREDLDCWLHCLEEVRTSVKVSYPLIGYRIIPGQISGKKWTMMQRHHLVLREYRLRSGRSLGLGATLFTATHFALALYYRWLKKSL